MSIATLVVEAAGDAEMSLAFNYGSEALNNDFFLDHLVRLLPRFRLTFFQLRVETPF